MDTLITCRHFNLILFERFYLIITFATSLACSKSRSSEEQISSDSASVKCAMKSDIAVRGEVILVVVTLDK